MTLSLSILFLVASASMSVLAAETNNETDANSAQNLCIMKHMVQAYTQSDDVTLYNMIKLFDAVTTGYHDRAPAHSHQPPLSSQPRVSEDNSTKAAVKNRRERKRRTVHLSGAARGQTDNSSKLQPEICEHGIEGTLHQCLPGSSILKNRGYLNNTGNLFSVEDFLSVCPALLFQLTMTPCIHHPHAFLREKTTTALPISATSTQPYLAWIGAVCAVITISVCGLGVISLIPLIKKSFYKQAIQFLVALAVGTLVGDSLLHLLPHALSEHKEVDTDLRSSSHHVWRASVSLLGIFIFFNAERVLGAITSIKRDKKAAENKAREGVDDRGDDTRSEAGSCGSCADVPYVTGHTSHATMKSKSFDEIRGMANEAHKELHAINKTVCRQSTELVHLAGEANCQQCPTSKSCPLGDINETGSTITHSSMPTLNHSKSRESHKHVTLSSDQALAPSVTTPLIRNGEPQTPTKLSEHGDAHTDLDEDEEAHGHSHDVPSSCSSVAYMVIMGDGLHNFTDGLAIGAAFSSSFSGGMSTSIAVLCHELPHELGDFAMLLKTGMSMKQAYLCNLVSASLQCIGAIIGVLIGNVDSASQWLFAFAGGIFLYVGLVDMLPEITRVDHKRVWKQLLLQNAGLLLGFTFMLLIAAFETDIENIFIFE